MSLGASPAKRASVQTSVGQRGVRFRLLSLPTPPRILSESQDGALALLAKRPLQTCQIVSLIADAEMADFDRRQRGGRGQFNNRKRRYRGRASELYAALWIKLTKTEDDDYDRRPQRRRYEEPLSVTLRKQVLSIAESVCSAVTPT